MSVGRNANHKVAKRPLKRFTGENGFYTDKPRAKLMSKIKSKDTKPELALRSALWRQHLRFRIHVKDLPGKPDIVFKKYKLAIFVDGNFWHGFDWEVKKHRIKSNAGFWIAKIERNMERDYISNDYLAEMGYTVMRFWDHQINTGINKCINQIMLFILASRSGDVPDIDSF